jgi:hypothetical protein
VLVAGQSQLISLVVRPSEHIRSNVRFTSQPMEFSDDPRHIHQLFEMVGADEFRMFSSDYPHWGFDNPERAIPASFPPTAPRPTRSRTRTASRSSTSDRATAARSRAARRLCAACPRHRATPAAGLPNPSQRRRSPAANWSIGRVRAG